MGGRRGESAPQRCERVSNATPAARTRIWPLARPRKSVPRAASARTAWAPKAQARLGRPQPRRANSRRRVPAPYGLYDAGRSDHPAPWLVYGTACRSTESIGTTGRGPRRRPPHAGTRRLCGRSTPRRDCARLVPSGRPRCRCRLPNEWSPVRRRTSDACADDGR